MQILAVDGDATLAFHCFRAEEIFRWPQLQITIHSRTSWILGTSNNSPKTYTPGAEVASWISFAAAAPFADLDINKKGSSLLGNAVPSSMVKD